MKYLNLSTGKQLDFAGLTDDERRFYSAAKKKFQENVEWLTFDEFALEMRSPIYGGRKSHLQVLKSPLYLALRDMSLQLGVQQGNIARRLPAERKRSVAARAARATPPESPLR